MNCGTWPKADGDDISVPPHLFRLTDPTTERDCLRKYQTTLPHPPNPPAPVNTKLQQTSSSVNAYRNVEFEQRIAL